MQSLAIVMLSIAACVAYGIVHDQITARICIEYFTIGHPQIIPTADPTVLAIAWGILATWWVGVVLGVPLAMFARIGQHPRVPAVALIQPIAILVGCSALFAMLAGGFGYLAASMGWVWLAGPIAASLPQDKHVAFLVALWAHSGSYLAGFAGGIVLMIWTWRYRRRIAISNKTEPGAERERATTPVLNT